MTYSFLPPEDPGVFVSDGDTVVFQYTAPPTWDTTLTVTIQIGGTTEAWNIITIPEDFDPDPLILQTYNGAPTDQLFTYADGSRPGENTSDLLISGLTPGTLAPINISSPQWQGDINNFAVSINGGPFFIPDILTTVENGDQLSIRLRSSPDFSTETYLTITIGTGTFRWTIKTEEPPSNTPEPFPEFTNLFNVPTNTVMYSNILQISGMNVPSTATVDNGEVCISPNSNTTTAADGQIFLTDGVCGTSQPVDNAEYIQLKLTSDSGPNSTVFSLLTIGAGSTTWSVETDDGLSETPDAISFDTVFDAVPFTLIGSNPEPPGGITGLAPGLSVDVVLLSSDDPSNVRVKTIDSGGIESSIGLLPTTVENGDQIVLYNVSGDFGETVSTQIQVGTLIVPTWQIQSATSPDTDPDFTPPSNLFNREPGISYNSSSVPITGINVPIDIDADNGALISIDFGPFVSGPVTFTPGVDSSFRLQLTASLSLNTTESTNVTLGDGSFTWSITTYVTAPPAPSFRGKWYSKKNDKFDGYAIGTILPILKESLNTGSNNFGYGDLSSVGRYISDDYSTGASGDSSLNRYPGFVECDGTSYLVRDLPDLWWVIGNTYGGNGSYDSATKEFSGSFNVPDYRNKKLVGNGRVDVLVSGSPTVFTTTNQPGGTGGYWYVDTVSVAGPEPFEQVIGDEGALEGDSSQFFELGTPRTVVIEDPTAEVDFDVVGDVNGIVGDLTEEFVSTPPHTHLVISAVSEDQFSEPVINWGDRALFTTNFSYGWKSDGFANFSGFDGGPGPDDVSGPPGAEGGRGQYAAVAPYRSYLTQFAPDFFSEVESVVGSPDTTEVLQAVTGHVANSGDDGIFEYDLRTWWPSPYDTIDDSELQRLVGAYNIVPSSEPGISITSGYTGGERTIWNLNTGSGDYRNMDLSNLTVTGNLVGDGSTLVTGVFDANGGTFRVNPYESRSGDYNSHSHLIGDQLITNPFTDFTYGNSAGFGNDRVGLPNFAEQLQIVFNQNAGAPGDGSVQVRNEVTEGIFVLNDAIKLPVPEVSFVPNRTVPVISPFHKTKYIIKAY